MLSKLRPAAILSREDRHPSARKSQISTEAECPIKKSGAAHQYTDDRPSGAKKQVGAFDRPQQARALALFAPSRVLPAYQLNSLVRYRPLCLIKTCGSPVWRIVDRKRIQRGPAFPHAQERQFEGSFTGPRFGPASQADVCTQIRI